MSDIDLDKSLTKDFYDEVAKGNIPGHAIVHKFGHNDAVGTSQVPISNSATYQMPSVITALEVLSASANDTIAGTGARVLRVIGIDTNWNELVQDINMNGVTPVAIPTSLFRVYRAYVLESGFYATDSLGSQEGLITIRVASAGATWALVNGVGGYFHSQTQIGAYTIPIGFTGLLLNTFIHVDANKTVDFFLFARADAQIVAAPFCAARIHSEFRGVQGSRSLTLKTPRTFTETTDIFWLAQVDSGTADVAIDFEVLVVDNNFLHNI